MLFRYHQSHSAANQFLHESVRDIDPPATNAIATTAISGCRHWTYRAEREERAQGLEASRSQQH